MEAARPLPAPHADAARSARPTLPTLPSSAARTGPRLESRAVEVDMTFAPRQRRTSMRAYLVGTVLLLAIAAGGWFALDAYIYG